MRSQLILAVLLAAGPVLMAGGSPAHWELGTDAVWEKDRVVFQKGKNSWAEGRLAPDSSFWLALILQQGAGQAEFILRDGDTDLARVALRKDKEGEGLPLHILEKNPDGKWQIVKDKSRTLTYRPSGRATMIWKNLQAHSLDPKRWFDQEIALHLVRRDHLVEFYVDGFLAMTQEIPGNAPISFRVELPPGDALVFRSEQKFSVPPSYQPLSLRAYLRNPTGPDLVKTVDGIPFLEPAGGRGIDLGQTSWPLASEMPSNYFAAYDSGPMFVHDRRNPTLWAPVADYSALHLLVRPTPEAARLADRFSIRLGTFGQGLLGGRGQVLQHDYHAAVPQEGEAQVLTVPLTELIAQDLSSAVQVSFNKEMRLARRSPDPSRFEFRPLGLPPGLELLGATLERAPVQMTLRAPVAGQVFEGTKEAAFQAILKNITNQAQPFSLQAEARDSAGTLLTETATGKLAPGETREVPLVVSGTQWGYYDLEVKLQGDGDGHPLRRRTSFALLPPDTRQHGAESPFGTWTFDGAHQTNSDPEISGSLLKKAGLRFGMGSFPEERKKWGVRNNFEVKAITEPEKYEKWKEKNPDALPVALLMHEHSLSADHVSRVPDAFTGRKPYQLSPAEKKQFKKLWDEQIQMAKLMREHFPDVHLRLGNGPLPTKEEFLRAGFPAELFDSLGNEAGSFGRLPETQPPDWVGNNSGLWMDHQLLKTYGYDKPVTQCYEINYPSTNPGNLTPLDQAAYFVRHGIHSLAWGIPEIRFGLLDDTANAYRFSNWGASGLVHAAPHLNPKPSYVAVATMTRLLDGAKFQRSLETSSPSVYAVELSKAGGQKVYVLWTLRGEREGVLTLSGRDWALTNWEGNTHALDVKNGTATVPLTNMPVYVTGQGSVESITPGAVVHAEKPTETASLVDKLNSLEGWTIQNEADPILEFHNPLTPRRLGNFSYEVMPDATALRIRAGSAEGATTLPMYGALVAKTPLVLPGEPTEIGLWIEGNSGWGRVIFELEDAKGQKWTSIGASRKGEISEWMLDWMPAEFAKATNQAATQADWNTNDVFGLSAINFDGWRYVRFPLPGNYPVEKAPWPGNSQWRFDQDGVVHYPLKLTRLIFELPENVLKLTDYRPVQDQTIAVRDLMVEYGTQGGAKQGVYENEK